MKWWGGNAQEDQAVTFASEGEWIASILAAVGKAGSMSWLAQI
jgi:hypothetical protein